MSLVLDAALCLGDIGYPRPKTFESVEVELFSDGRITIAGFDKEYHQSALEFGYSAPPELSLINYWHWNPEIVISTSLDIPNSFISRVALDWAEHVLPIHKQRFQYDTRPTEAIAAARAFLDDPSDQNDYNLRKMFIEVTKCEQEIQYQMGWSRRQYLGVSTKHAANSAARAIARAVGSADPGNDASMYESTIQYTAIHARVAVAYRISDTTDDEDPRYMAASNKEKAWQIKRFVEAMEIVGQGGKWPPMEVTP